MIVRRLAGMLTISVASANFAGAQQGPQLVGFGGRVDGLLALGVAARNSAAFYGADWLSNAPGKLHWTFGLTHSSVTDRNVCCGAAPTLSYHYNAFLPSVGVTYDFVRKPVRVRLDGNAGPLILRQSRSGVPPAGVSGGDPDWQWQFLATSYGGSVHYAVTEEFGLLAGIRRYVMLSLFADPTEGQRAPYFGASWTLRKRNARSNVRESPGEIDTIARNGVRLASALYAIDKRTPLRLAARGSLYEGQYAAMRGDSLVITRAFGADTLLLGDVTTVWKPVRRVARSTFVGAAVGAGFTAALVSFLAEPEECDDFCISPTGMAVLGAIPGAVAGALVGNIVGWVHRPWRRIYP